MFCILFCGDEQDYCRKVEYLFYLMCDDENVNSTGSSKITARNGNTKAIIKILTIIACMIPSEIIKLERQERA